MKLMLRLLYAQPFWSCDLAAQYTEQTQSSNERQALEAARASTCRGREELTNPVWGGGWDIAVKVGPLVLLGVKALYKAARAGKCHCRGGSTDPARGEGSV
jgi:hypothetical protein